MKNQSKKQIAWENYDRTMKGYRDLIKKHKIELHHDHKGPVNFTEQEVYMLAKGYEIALSDVEKILKKHGKWADMKAILKSHGW